MLPQHRCLMNLLKLVIPLSFISWKKTPNGAVTPQRQSQFTPKMKTNAVPCLLSSLVWIDQYNECNGMTSFMGFMMWENTLPRSLVHMGTLFPVCLMTSGRCVTSAHFAKPSLAIAKSKNKEKTLRIKIIASDGATFGLCQACSRRGGYGRAGHVGCVGTLDCP